MTKVHAVSPEFSEFSTGRMEEPELRERLRRYREMVVVNAIRAVAAECPGEALLLSSHRHVVEIDCNSLAAVRDLKDIEELIRAATARRTKSH